MPANIKTFLSSFKGELAKNSLFEVYIYGGPLAIFGSKYPTEIKYRCENKIFVAHQSASHFC